MVEEKEEGRRGKGRKGQGEKGRLRILAEVQELATAEVAGRRGGLRWRDEVPVL